MCRRMSKRRRKFLGCDEDDEEEVELPEEKDDEVAHSGNVVGCGDNGFEERE